MTSKNFLLCTPSLCFWRGNLDNTNVSMECQDTLIVMNGCWFGGTNTSTCVMGTITLVDLLCLIVFAYDGIFNLLLSALWRSISWCLFQFVSKHFQPSQIYQGEVGVLYYTPGVIRTRDSPFVLGCFQHEVEGGLAASLWEQGFLWYSFHNPLGTRAEPLRGKHQSKTSFFVNWIPDLGKWGTDSFTCMERKREEGMSIWRVFDLFTLLGGGGLDDKEFFLLSLQTFH